MHYTCVGGDMKISVGAGVKQKTPKVGLGGEKRGGGGRGSDQLKTWSNFKKMLNLDSFWPALSNLQLFNLNK